MNARTLEIFRQAGFDMAAIEAIAKDPVDAGWVNFVTRLNGELIGRLPFERQGDECLALTPTPLRNISQHRLEPLMAAALATEPLVEIRHGVEWVSGEQDGDGVTSIVRDVESGDGFAAGPIVGHWDHGFALRRLKLATGATIPMHARAEQEVIFVQSGTLEFTWDGGRLVMGAGDTLTVPIGLMHAFRNPASADAIAFVIRGASAPAAPVFAESRVAAE